MRSLVELCCSHNLARAAELGCGGMQYIARTHIHNMLAEKSNIPSVLRSIYTCAGENPAVTPRMLKARMLPQLVSIATAIATYQPERQNIVAQAVYVVLSCQSAVLGYTRIHVYTIML